MSITRNGGLMCSDRESAHMLYIKRGFWHLKLIGAQLPDNAVVEPIDPPHIFFTLVGLADGQP